MKRICLCLTIALLFALGSRLSARSPKEAGNINDYLAKDGKLKERLTLNISLGGGGLTGAYGGTVWIIEPSGAWTQETTGGLAGEKFENRLVAKGQLTEQQLRALAHHFAAQDFKSLPADVPSIAPPDTSGGLSVGIGFGKTSTGLNTSRRSLAEFADARLHRKTKPRQASAHPFVLAAASIRDRAYSQKGAIRNAFG